MIPKPFAFGFVMMSVVAVLIVIVMIVLGEYTKTRGRFLLTALIFEGYFFCSLGPVWVAERRADSPLSRVALAAAVAALLLLLTGIWGTPNSDAFWKSTAIVTVLALVLSYVAVVDVQPERLARSYQVKAVALATVIACFGIAADIKWPPYWWVFTLAALAWVGTLLVPLVGYLARRVQGR